MIEATYSFTVPSAHDDTSLECRIYHRANIRDVVEPGRGQVRRGAIIAHPYAPLGGCYDDAVVLALVESLLLEEGYIVATFNFRGAGKSGGKTSWTGRPEVDDYASVVGLLIYYLSNLSTSPSTDLLTPVMSLDNPAFNAMAPNGEATPSTHPSLDILLAGYSFGALILSRLPSVDGILQRFESTEKGTAACEIFLRARTLAKQTKQSIEATQSPKVSRGRQISPTGSPARSQFAVVVGGDELDASDRRRSRDSRRSVDVMRDVPHNLKNHMRRHSGNSRRPSSEGRSKVSAATATFAPGQSGPSVKVRYLLISPVLVPFSTTLLSPGLPFTEGSSSDEETGVLALKQPTMIVFGTVDAFTPGKKLRQWAERLQKQSMDKTLCWKQIEGAGHFWREKGVMKDLKSEVRAWLKPRTSL